jgi:phosphatidylethanolamine-binding protein (PEBP) family uncharacterized protein
VTISGESPDITDGGPIPAQYTCDGADVSAQGTLVGTYRP